MLTPRESYLVKEILELKEDNPALAIYANESPMGVGSLVDKALESISVTQEELIRELIEVYLEVQFDTDMIKAEGLDSNPYRQRRLLKGRLANYIGLNLAYFSQSSGVVERG
jgi:hypothetical protein